MEILGENPHFGARSVPFLCPICKTEVITVSMLDDAEYQCCRCGYHFKVEPCRIPFTGGRFFFWPKTVFH